MRIMKFIASSSSLLKQLQSIGGVLNNNNTLAILDNFLFNLNNICNWPKVIKLKEMLYARYLFKMILYICSKYAEIFFKIV